MTTERRTPQGFWAAWTAVAIDLLGFGIVIPLLPLYAERFEASPFAIGVLFASYSLAQFVFSPIWGRVSDRVGRRPVMLVTIAGSAIGSLMVGLAGSLALLFVGRIVDGISGASVAVARATVADVATPAERPRLMGLLGAAFGVGFVIGPSIGALAVLAGPAVPFFVAAALSAVNFVMAAARLPETRPAGAALGRPSAPSGRQPAAVLRLVSLTFVALTAFSAFEATFSLLADARLRVDEATIALVFAGLGVVLVATQGGLVGPVTDRLGENGVIRLGPVLNSAGFVLLALAEGWTLLVPGLAVLALGQGLLTPTLSSAVAGATTPDRCRPGDSAGCRRVGTSRRPTGGRCALRILDPTAVCAGSGVDRSGASARPPPQRGNRLRTFQPLSGNPDATAVRADASFVGLWR